MADRQAPPHRRLRLVLDLEADDLDELRRALHVIGNDLDYEGIEQRETTSGGLRLWLPPHDPPPLSAEEVEMWANDPFMPGVAEDSPARLHVMALAREVQARRAAQPAPPSDRAEGRDVHTDRCHGPSCPCFLDGRWPRPACP